MALGQILVLHGPPTSSHKFPMLKIPQMEPSSLKTLISSIHSSTTNSEWFMMIMLIPTIQRQVMQVLLVHTNLPQQKLKSSSLLVISTTLECILPDASPSTLKPLLLFTVDLLKLHQPHSQISLVTGIFNSHHSLLVLTPLKLRSDGKQSMLKTILSTSTLPKE